MKISEIEEGKHYWVLKNNKAFEVKVESVDVKIGFYIEGWLQTTAITQADKLFKTKQELLDSI